MSPKEFYFYYEKVFLIIHPIYPATYICKLMYKKCNDHTIKYLKFFSDFGIFIYKYNANSENNLVELHSLV